jgi:adenine/guanine phosphoribosyltransferase-like PRPP-binding protein
VTAGGTGAWVAQRLGVHVEGDGVEQLVGVALRRNPRRAHLLVSLVLGKHVPTDPRLVRAAGLALGALVAEVLDGRVRPTVDLGPALDGQPGAAAAARDAALELAGSGSSVTVPAGSGSSVTVLGYAETATALGHLVAEALDADVYLHSTRRPVAGASAAGGFAEEHSHATEHLLLPSDPGVLTGSGPLVLVDDELSTGRTVANTLRALHRLAPRPHYVVAALVDLRAPQDHAVLQHLAAELGARVDVVALAAGTVRVPDDVLVAGAALVAAHAAGAVPGATSGTPVPAHPVPAHPVRADPVRVDLGWPVALPDGGRHGVLRAHRARLEVELPAMAARLAATVPRTGEVLVLGFEELMHAPLRLAEALADAHPGLVVRSSTTTRSPVLAVDAAGYAVRHRLVFAAHDRPADGPGERYAYNVAPGRFDAVVLVVDTPGDTPELAGLLQALAGVTASVVLAVLPSHRPGGPQ